jgi:glycerophosphoryl diester phosphodiesterase
MQVISHRGYWKTPAEKNTTVAFARSFSMGFGTETDVRDLNGELVISHDMPCAPAMTLEHYLQGLAAFDSPGLTQAINIKADGTAHALATAMKSCRHPWFVFDMSVPDMLQHLRVGNPTFARMSEYEPLPTLLLNQIRGIWLDAFRSTWYSRETIESLLKRGLQVCVVSPELHGRDDQAQLWAALRHIRHYEGLILCTDLPEDANKALA